MRGIVLKNHFDPTATLAYTVRRQVPGFETFGGIVLNRTVGGINARAVEHMTGSPEGGDVSSGSRRATLSTGWQGTLQRTPA